MTCTCRCGYCLTHDHQNCINPCHAEMHRAAAEHVVTRVNDGWYVCRCGQTGSERWAIQHEFPSQP